MSRVLRNCCLTAVVALVGASWASAESLPVGVWQVNAGPDGQGELVIKAIKDNGALVGTIFGKPLQGTWDGTRLSFTFHDVTERWYEAWLVKEKQGSRVRWTLTGVRKFFTFYPVDGNNWWTAGGWFAQLDRRP